MARNSVFKRSLLITVSTLGFAGDARSEPPDAALAIQDIIPHQRVGDEICFEGTYAGRTLDMQDWAHTTQEPVPGQAINEKEPSNDKPATRTVPTALPKRDVSRIALHLTYHNRLREGSFDVMFTVSAASKDLGRELLARSGCIWSGWSDGEERLPQTKLGCWIECDGGGMTVERIPGTQSVNLSFSQLSMQAGCDGGGAYRVGTGDDADKINFRLEKVPLEVCRPLKIWGQKEWPE
jgi:hypothetical protein